MMTLSPVSRRPVLELDVASTKCKRSLSLVKVLMALYLPGIELVGISSVHGNGTLEHTTINAARIVCSLTSAERADKLPVLQGSAKPLLRPARHDTEIHGIDGLGGVEGLLDATHPAVQRKLSQATSRNAVEAMAEAARAVSGGKPEDQLVIVATGTMTDVALFVATYPDLVRDKVSQIVLMGGAEGRGNRSPCAEFNLLADPESAAIVFDAQVPVVMVPLNITHTNLFSPADNERLLALEAGAQGKARTPLRWTLSTLLNFFAETYARVFGFTDGPPVHDPLCLAWLTHPHLFKSKRYRVDVEVAGTHTAGTTVVDLWEYRKADLTAMVDPESRESWGRLGKNVLVLEQVDVAAFWSLFLECVERADLESPLNKTP